MSFFTVLLQAALALFIGALLLVLMGKTLTWPLFLYLFCTDFMPEWAAAHHSQHIITIIVLALIPTLYWGLRLFLWWRDRQFAVSQFKGDIRMKIFEMEHQMPDRTMTGMTDNRKAAGHPAAFSAIFRTSPVPGGWSLSPNPSI